MCYKLSISALNSKIIKSPTHPIRKGAQVFFYVVKSSNVKVMRSWLIYPRTEGCKSSNLVYFCPWHVYLVISFLGQRSRSSCLTKPRLKMRNDDDHENDIS